MRRFTLACLAAAFAASARAQTAPNGETEIDGNCSGVTQVCMITPGVVAPNPWPYLLAQNANTSIATFSDAVEASFLVWGTQPNSPASDGVSNASVPCSSLRTTQTGTDSAPTAARIGDGQNSVGVNVTDSTNPQYCYLNAGGCQGGGGGSTAVGLAVEENDGTHITECDVYYNSVDYQFADYLQPGPGANTIDIETVANQEVGHCFGLNHYLTNQQAVMYPYVSVGQVRPALEPHDINNVCALYPVAGAFGGTCNAGNACTSPNTCVNDGTSAYCSNGCTPDAGIACPAGFHCAAVPSGGSPAGQNFCLAGASNAGVPIGAQCADANPADCNTSGTTTGQCIPPTFTSDAGTQSTGFPNGYCTAPCTALADGGVAQADCPTGDYCLAQAAGSTTGFCVKGCPGFFPGSAACGRTDGYACQPQTQSTGPQGQVVFGGFICFPGCETDADCLAASQQVGQTLSCRTADNSCYVAGGNSAAKAGDPCAADTDCPLGGSCATAAQGWPGGYCIVAFCGANPTGVCGAGGDCVILDAQSNYGQCYGSCTLLPGGQSGQSDCRSGYLCQPDAVGSSNGICVAAPPSASTSSSGSTGLASAASSSGAGSQGVTGGSAGSSGSGTGGQTGAATSSVGGFIGGNVAAAGSSGTAGQSVTSSGAGTGAGASGAKPALTNGGTFSGGKKTGCSTGAGDAPLLLALAALALRRRR